MVRRILAWIVLLGGICLIFAPLAFTYLDIAPAGWSTMDTPTILIIIVGAIVAGVAIAWAQSNV